MGIFNSSFFTLSKDESNGVSDKNSIYNYYLKHRKELIDFYKNDRRFIPSNSDNNNDNENKNEEKLENKNQNVEYVKNDDHIRVMSFNILADGERYALNERHNYCPKKYRLWEYRFPRIVAQIEAYEPDVICVQETSPYTYEKSIEPILNEIGYEGIHAGHDVRNGKTIFGFKNHLSDAVFYKKSRIQVLNQKIFFLHELSELATKEELGNENSGFRQFLSATHDVIIVLHLKNIKTNDTFILCSSHFHWDPRRSDIKCAQAYLFSKHVYDLVIGEWKISNDIRNVPLVFGVDANSLPEKLMTDEFDPVLPDDGVLISGAYQILTQGNLTHDNFDFPKKRAELRIQESKDDEKLRKEKEYLDCIQENWKTNIKWTSAYRKTSIDNKEPIITTKTLKFAACIDYIFISGFDVISFLELPYQKKLNYHCRPSSLSNEEINKQKQIELKNIEKLLPMPSEIYPSDHIALCVDLKISQQVIDNIQKN